MSTAFTLPDFNANWPFQRTLHSHYESIGKDSAEWVESYHLLDDEAQNAFNRCKFSLLTYPYMDLKHFRNGASVRGMAARLVDILRDPLKNRPQTQSTIELMTADFWSNALEISSPSSAKIFVDSMVPYIEGVCQEAEDRESGHVRNIKEYLSLRRKTVGAKPCFDFLLLSVDLPEEIITHPHVADLTRTAVDLIILSNDAYSWNYEGSHGLDEHNIVSVVMAEKNLDIQSAIDYVGEWFYDEAQKFVESMNNTPLFSETIDLLVAEYIFGLGNWVTGFLEWAFKSERYFGTNGPEIKSSRVVKLLPRHSKAGK